MTAWKSRIGRAFGQAEGYAAHAHVQARVADALATRVAALPQPPAPRVLEIGCGTGFLSVRVADAWPAADLLLTDLAPAMLDRCRRHMGDRPARYLVMDGEAPSLAPGYDLIISSLAMQWFEDLPTALDRLAALLAPGGWLAFSTLADGSFAEWRAAHAAHGLIPATPAYPNADAFAALRPAGLSGAVTFAQETEHHASGRAFLAALKAIGAGTPRAGEAPLSPGQLRRVLRSFEAMGASVSYHVATGLFQRPVEATR